MAPNHILINTVDMSHERSSSSMGGTDKWVRSGFCKCNDVVRVHPIRVPNERFARLPIKESHRLLSLSLNDENYFQQITTDNCQELI